MKKELKTNWNVITGGPCTGKTTVINLLSERGYKTTIEHARHYIDTQKIKGKTVEEIKENIFKIYSKELEPYLPNTNLIVKKYGICNPLIEI